MITAAHVLEGMRGEKATLYLREKVGGQYRKLPHTLTIRKDGKPLWTRHPTVDVGVMYVDLPVNCDIRLLDAGNFLIIENALREYEIHPGDDLLCLGYPFGIASNEAGFPVLRSGRIASFPITPAKDTKTFLLDFEIFGGNSGGPVYFSQTNRTYGGKTHLGQVQQFLMGMVVREAVIPPPVATHSIYLKLAECIHAPMIQEAIDLLPEKP